MTNQVATSRTVRGRAINCGLALHRVPDRIVTTSLADQMHRHVGPGWYAVVMFADGRGVAAGEKDDTAAPPEWAVDWMAKAAVALNKDLHEDGHWIVAWAPAGEPNLLWRDGDGDLHVVTEIACKADRPETLAEYDRARLLNLASESLAEATALLAKLALSKRQTIRNALGESPLRH